MGYFNNPGTLDELDSQFNELLNQYEYRSGKNISTIDEIRNEYKKIKAQMKKQLQAAAKAEKSYSQSYTGRAVENYNTDLSAHGMGSDVFVPGANAAQSAQRNDRKGPTAALDRLSSQRQTSDDTGEKNDAGREVNRNNYADELVRQSDYDWQKIFQTGEFAPKVQTNSANAAADHDSKMIAQNSEGQAVQTGQRQAEKSDLGQAEQSDFIQSASYSGAGNSAWQNKLKNVQVPKPEEDARYLLSTCKENITEIIREVTRDRTSDSYNMLEDAVFTYDDEVVTSWFNMHIDSMVSRTKAHSYQEVRMKLEKEFKDAAQDRQTEAAYLLKIDKMIGAFIKKKFMEFEILYKDYEQEAEQQNDDTDADRQLKRRGYILGIVMGVLIFAIGCFFGLIGTIIGFICAVIAAIVIGRTYYIWRMPDEK